MSNKPIIVTANAAQKLREMLQEDTHRTAFQVHFRGFG